jgi:transcriptional regulator with XRE-family HTH domain
MGSQSLLLSVVMTPADKRFFQDLGARIAQARKEQELTQEELAQLLGISQQMVASYEVGRRKVPASLLPVLARLLVVPVDTLLGVNPGRTTKRGPTPKLQQHFERIGQLPKPKQRFVLEMLETVLAQASR